MATNFVVTFDGNVSFTVGVEQDNYTGTAVVLVEALVAIKGMDREEAIAFYSNNEKHITNTSLFMKGASVVRVKEEPTFTFSAPNDTEEYWGDWGMQ